jgi:hypothetical protein
MEEIRFNNLKIMVDTIREHTQTNCTYVLPYEDLRRAVCGWFCEQTKTLFTMSEYVMKTSTLGNYKLALDTPLKRKIASIYLSNCSNDAEYQLLIDKINKLKAFW